MPYDWISRNLYFNHQGTCCLFLYNNLQWCHYSPVSHANYYVTWCTNSLIQKQNAEVKGISFPFVRDVLQRDHIQGLCTTGLTFLCVLTTILMNFSAAKPTWNHVYRSFEMAPFFPFLLISTCHSCLLLFDVQSIIRKLDKLGRWLLGIPEIYPIN